MVLKFIFPFAFAITSVLANRRCNIGYKSPTYHLVAKCYRSQMTTIARANYLSLSSCERLATDKRGLAFNFSPPEESSKIDLFEEYNFKTCLVLDCPETFTALSLVNDTRYDYYSMYTNPLPVVNSTCLSNVGIFTLELKKMNYTNAMKHCAQNGGVLATPTNEIRTNSLANLVSNSIVDTAYVGMDNLNTIEEGAYRTSAGEFLDCTTYRAWAPGHPKHRHSNSSCVTITSQRTWKVVPCKELLVFICEIYSSGPYIPGSLNATCLGDGLYCSETDRCGKPPVRNTGIEKSTPRKAFFAIPDLISKSNKN